MFPHGLTLGNFTLLCFSCWNIARHSHVNKWHRNIGVPGRHGRHQRSRRSHGCGSCGSCGSRYHGRRPEKGEQDLLVCRSYGVWMLTWANTYFDTTKRRFDFDMPKFDGYSACLAIFLDLSISHQGRTNTCHRNSAKIDTRQQGELIDAGKRALARFPSWKSSQLWQRLKKHQRSVDELMFQKWSWQRIQLKSCKSWKSWTFQKRKRNG